ncbi:hypothetical protein E2562_009935 [Oryza meyeriana var. granulata]|uniref:Glycosyltransferase n=1 Tax=Oryza meyeriana var. granulata TaxID=110450 RepID=A0A6G1EII0_9ORYZ|nr:hypothetical protein E2562_009935 [Oryza meyeriana var. granulata]
MRTKTFVLFPSLGVGHLNPTVELAKHLRRRGLGVVVAVIDPPDKDATTADAMARLAAANPSITFRLLPPPSSPDADAHPVRRTLDTLRLANAVLRELLRSLPPVDALLLDMFCVDALDVAAELAIPAYFFFPSPASALAVFLHVPYYYHNVPSFRDMDKAALLRFPGMPPIRTVDMLATLHDKESEPTKIRLYQFKRMAEGKGVLVNSFDWLERKALKALAAGVCVPDKPTPRIYCIGPLVDAGNKGGNGSGERHACLSWLDSQPRQSVVFLCFGSKGAFPAAQLKEIACGLESSGHRFLWAVRNPPEEQSTSLDPDLERLLPTGFLERTKDRGMVVKNWVPQAEVVQHEAVGAFVTHCGWNSTLEAIMSALPMICWPLYAEQASNKVFMVEEVKIAVSLDGYEEGGLVKAEEVEAKVRLVMETEEGRNLRERLVKTRDMALDAIKEGGSSEVAFDEFMRDLEKNSLETGGRS